MTSSPLSPSFENRAHAIAEEFGHDVARLEFQYKRRAFGSFTTTLSGSAEQRRLYRRALEIARIKSGQVKRIKLRVRVDVEVPALGNDVSNVAAAVGELRRTLEAEGYSPSIDYCGDAS